MKRIGFFIIIIFLMLSVSCDNYFDDIAMQTKLTEGLIAYWPVTESSGTVVKDLSDNNNLIVTDGSYSDGKFGKSINCSTSTAIEVTKNNYFFQNNKFSVLMWINPANNNTTLFYTNLSSLAIEQNGNTLDIYIVDPDDLSNLVLTASNILTYDKWNYIAITYDSNTVSIYKNGILNKSSNFSSGITTVCETINLAGGNWVGFLDEIRIYNRALDKEEIKALMEIGIE